MKDIFTIEERLKTLKTNIRIIKNIQGKDKIQAYIEALGWVLSPYEDNAQELMRKVKTRW